MQIEIKGLTKLSFNVYKNQHWAKQKAFKDTLRMLVKSSTKETFKGGYSLNFMFEFTGRRLDTINVFHYCKIIEDKLFDQDKDNRQICVNVKKGLENKCTLYLSKLK
tara:strand:+ start:1098 stop:1418 length:321 start_codon:yes stop_codon:yes gene_type:complete